MATNTDHSTLASNPSVNTPHELYNSWQQRGMNYSIFYFLWDAGHNTEEAFQKLKYNDLYDAAELLGRQVWPGLRSTWGWFCNENGIEEHEESDDGVKLDNDAYPFNPEHPITKKSLVLLEQKHIVKRIHWQEMYASCPANGDKYETSFRFAGRLWLLVLYPNGKLRGRAFGAFLQLVPAARKPSPEKFATNYFMAFRKPDGTAIEGGEGHCIWIDRPDWDPEGFQHGWDITKKFLKKSELGRLIKAPILVDVHIYLRRYEACPAMDQWD